VTSGKINKIFNEVFDSLAFDSLPIPGLCFDNNAKGRNQKNGNEGQYPNHVGGHLSLSLVGHRKVFIIVSGI
jgi:hypothetical protein